MRIIDRYVIRQAILPFCMALLVFTFILIIPSLIEYAETFVARGVPTLVVLRLMGTLVPQSLALTIPIALLVALLVAFGRLSADREFVAMQACGISLGRLLRPVGVLALLCWAATSYVLITLMPAGNTTFRAITFNIVASSAEGDVRPGIFFDRFRDLVLYVREVSNAGGGWDGVFMADTRPGEPRAVYVARHGRVAIDRQAQTVALVLNDGSRHTVEADGTLNSGTFDRLVLSLDSQSVFPTSAVTKDDNSMTIAELRARVDELEQAGISPHNQLIAIQRKFAIPLACFIFGLFGLALGVTNRRDGTLGGFVLGLIVVFLYYIPLNLGPAMAKGGVIPPWLAAWLPNIVLGGAAIGLFVWRRQAADQPIRLPLAVLGWFTARWSSRSRQRSGRRLPFVPILDHYVTVMYLRFFLLAALGMIALFYISTFIDLSDKIFKGSATWTMLGAYFWYELPQYAYYILPLAVLLAALIAVGVLTKNSELVVMKACGISLYRMALPLIAIAILIGGLLFLLDRGYLGPANRQADALRHTMNGGTAQTFDVVAGRWIVGRDGTIYHYDFLNPRTRQLNGLDVFEFTPAMERLTRRTTGDRAVAVGRSTDRSDAWRLERGTVQEFDAQGTPLRVSHFDQAPRIMESPAYFGADELDPKYMSASQLRGYIERRRSSGVNVLADQVMLARKFSFPFVTLIMTLIAIPFAVTTGRRGAMAGLGVGIVLAVTYWTTISVFGAMGSGGLLAPALAAWAPNLLFGTGAAYLLLTVRT